MRRMHFISGLPRSGSTLLSALLMQNPRFHASMSSALAPLVAQTVHALGATYDYTSLIGPNTRRNVVSGLFDSFYADHPGDQVIFDTNRAWCARMPLLAEVFDTFTVVACVRNPIGILDSFERLFRKNALIAAKTIPQASNATMHARIDYMMSRTGVVGFALNALQEAVFGTQAHKLVLVDFLSLVNDGPRTIARLYDRLGEESFEHDFENIVFKEGAKFDDRVGMPGLHTVGRSLKPRDQQGVVLSPDIRRRFAERPFWEVEAGSGGARFDLI